MTESKDGIAHWQRKTQVNHAMIVSPRFSGDGPSGEDRSVIWECAVRTHGRAAEKGHLVSQAAIRVGKGGKRQ